MKTVFQSFVLLAVSLSPTLAVAQINGFTKPYREIELSSDESGAIAVMNVEEGAVVNKDDVIARLDDRVQRLQVESAQHLVNSTSALDAARQYFEKREAISQRIRQLIATGHATESELIRSELERSIAESKYLSAEEETVGREIDLRRAEILLERRAIKTPFDGVVAKIHRKQGEFLSPLRPEIVTLIQIDTLLAEFNVHSSQISSLQEGKTVVVSFNDSARVKGTVHSIGIQTDAESGTVEVKVRLKNDKNKIRSGEQCYLEL